MQHESRPLLLDAKIRENDGLMNGKKQSMAFRILSIISVLAMIVVFLAYNEKGFKFFSHKAAKRMSGVSKAGKINSFIDWEDSKLTPDLMEMGEQLVELANDNGELSVESFTSLQLKGTFTKESEQRMLSYVIDGAQKFISFELTDLASNEISQSFFTQKTADPARDDYYQFDGMQVDVNDVESMADHFAKFFASSVTVDIIELSLKIAAHGFSGNMAKSTRMLHGFAVHLAEFPEVSSQLPATFNINRQRLNDYFTKDESSSTSSTDSNGDSRESGENDNSELVSAVSAKGGISDDWCLLFWCTSDDSCPDATDGCPSYCYTQGACALEDKCDNECFGMCGSGCSCWSWVCGDCLCHCLCENHDYFCSCESMTEYNCWAVWAWIDDDCD